MEVAPKEKQETLERLGMVNENVTHGKWDEKVTKTKRNGIIRWVTLLESLGRLYFDGMDVS